MSDPQNPYGSAQDPYGQPEQAVPPTQPDAYRQPQDPYAQPQGQSYTQQYGQQYGQAYGQAYGGYQQPGPTRRPGTVTAAAVTTFVLSGLMTLVFGIAVIAVTVAGDEIAREFNRSFRQESGMEGFSGSGVAAGLTVLMLVLLLWSVIAIVLAALAMKGRNWARITLVVSSAVTAVFALLAITSLLPVIWLVGAVAVIVLLFTGGANEWYAEKARSRS